MSTFRGRSLINALAAAAMIGGSNQLIHEPVPIARPQTKKHAIPTFSLLNGRAYADKPNGGHRRKVAIRAARLHKGGRVRFGKHR